MSTFLDREIRIPLAAVPIAQFELSCAGELVYRCTLLQSFPTLRYYFQVYRYIDGAVFARSSAHHLEIDLAVRQAWAKLGLDSEQRKSLYSVLSTKIIFGIFDEIPDILK
jgi:hypothetical protein